MGCHMDKTYTAASLEEPALQGYTPYTLPSDNELQYFDRYTIISRCRDLAINNPLAKAIVDVLVSHVVGGGLTPQVIGNEQAEKDFKLWCKNHKFGAFGSFYQLQELVLRTVLLSGDILVNTIIDDFGEFCIQLIEPERVTNPSFGINTPSLRNGVEIDETGCPKKYHVLSNHPAEPTGYTNFVLDAKDEDGDIRAWLVFKPHRPDQQRGVPIFSSVVDKFKMLDRYLNSELLASVISSNFCVFVESPSAYSPLGENTDVTKTDGSQVKELKMRPGMIVQLAPGEKVQTANPTRPNANLEPFVIALTKIICSGVGLSHEVVTMSFEANYSASKAAMAQSWKTVTYWRRLIVDYFCTRIFDLWCRYYGHEKLDVEWQGSSRVILDDAKEVSAAVERVNLGISSRKEECEELRGKDWQVTNQYLQKEKELGYGGNTQGQQSVLDTGELMY